MVERRSRLRIPLESKVELRGGDRVFDGTVEDITVDGIKLASNERCEPGAVLDFQVVATEGKSHLMPIEGRFRVERVEGDGPPYSLAGVMIDMKRPKPAG